ncbi:hypothetical protein [Alcanivorax sp.]|uniref:hypothetical protein n=1 Tax=Alcanivorax sp. TaxID=1872427 RepID=UPI000C0D1741|nr:hypothetical protein [Alcanivorax sp.]PHR68515.1 MAG: hypothetical protein COA55_00410 [Alcanivorax sp.]
MRIYRDGEYFATGADLALIASVADEPVSLYSFHPDDYRAYKLAEIKAACEAELSALQSAYPQSEVLSWDKQEREARAFVENPAAPVPLISALAAAREVDPADLVDWIILKADAYTAAIGAALGKRQKLEDQLAALADWEDMAEVHW